jgi:hypothetical protein
VRLRVLLQIGTYGNVRTAVEARRGMAPAFSTAFRSGVCCPPKRLPTRLAAALLTRHPPRWRAGSVMGFLLSSLALLMLYGAIQLYRLCVPLRCARMSACMTA